MRSSLLKRLNPSFSPSFDGVQLPTESLGDMVLDNWIDGILILTEDGHWIGSNALGRCICDRINQDYPSESQIPQEIWDTCEILIQSRRDFPNHLRIAEAELKLKQAHTSFRIRAQWFSMSQSPDPHILIILENQTYSQQNLAITEAIKYGFSPREIDVWTLHRMGYSYQDIAAELHIAINTVKKHMKNIYAKQHLDPPMAETYAEKLAS